MNSDYYLALDLLGFVAVAGWVLIAAITAVILYHVFICKRCRSH